MESVAKIRVLEVISDSSSIRFTGHVAGDGLFEVARVGVESNEFLVQCFELFLEVFVAHGLAGSHAQVTAGVERPALRFNFLERGRLAKAGHIAEAWERWRPAGRSFPGCRRDAGAPSTEHFLNLRAGFVTAEFDFAFEAVDGEVQAIEGSGFVGFLGAVDGDFGGGRTAVPYLSV